MKSLKINALAAILVRVLNIIFPLITGPYIARTLSKENIGYFDSANILVQLLIPLATFGVYNYGIRNISKVKNDKAEINKLFSELFYVSAISTLFMSSIYLLYVGAFSNLDSQAILYTYYILGFQLFCQFLAIEWLNEAFENYTFILYKTIIVRLVMFTLTFVMIKDADDLLAYAFVMTLAEVLNILLSFIWIKREVKLVRVPLRRLSKLFYLLFPMLILANVNMLYTYLDRIFLSNADSSTYIADYVMAQNIVMIITGIITGAISVNIPRLSYYLGHDQEDEYNKLIYKGSQVFLFFTIPIAFGIAILASDIAVIYGGDKFLTAGLSTAIFALRSIVLAVNNVLGIQIIFIKGYEKMMTLFVFIGGLSNLTLNTILYKFGQWNAEYFIATTLISEIIVTLIYIGFINKNKLFDIRPILKNSLRYTLTAASFVLISYLCNLLISYETYMSIEHFSNIACKIALSALTYFCILHFTKDTVMIDIITFIKKKIRRS
ncbi:MAG: oligosaccharide flippase family protein [Gemella sp.]|nr:oligosaccharide flippase family protein [Gemella sp.]